MRVADAVCFAGIVQRRLFTDEFDLSFSKTPGTNDFHIRLSPEYMRARSKNYA